VHREHAISSACHWARIRCVPFFSREAKGVIKQGKARHDGVSTSFLRIRQSSRLPSPGLPTPPAAMSVPRRFLRVARPPTIPCHHTARPTQSAIVSARQQSNQATRKIHQQTPRKAQQGAAAQEVQYESTNPALSFPCLDAHESRSASLSRRSLSGPEPSYVSGHTLTFHSKQPILLDWGGILPEFKVAYETWGTLNEDKSNAVLLHTGLSASSHAHSTETNTKPGWWEKFIGPDGPLDTNKYFVICTNVVGGCYGSTGPSSIDPANGERYATRFPILTMEDMVRAQFRLLDNLGIQKLYASVGSSMGGMQSLAAGTLFSDRVGRIVSISGCARSHPYSIAMRHTQRQGRSNTPPE
jgi:hypothetical protein